jgi:hypothetical protein
MAAGLISRVCRSPDIRKMPGFGPLRNFATETALDSTGCWRTLIATSAGFRLSAVLRIGDTNA